jgi:hypothetical protein
MQIQGLEKKDLERLLTAEWWWVGLLNCIVINVVRVVEPLIFSRIVLILMTLEWTKSNNSQQGVRTAEWRWISRVDRVVIDIPGVVEPLVLGRVILIWVRLESKMI